MKMKLKHEIVNVLQNLLAYTSCGGSCAEPEQVELGLKM